MNQSLFLLVKVQLQNQLRLNSLKEKSTKSKKNVILLLSTFLILGIVLVIYSFSLGFGLGSIGLANIIPAYALTITAILNLFFTFIKTNGILFGFRDYDLLMSLPISTKTLITSRFMTMYMMNTLVSAIIMIPMAIAYFMFEHLSLFPVFAWICGILFAALIPTTIACAAGAILMGISSRLKHTKMISVLLTFLLFIILMGFSITGGIYGEQMTVTDISEMGTYLYQNFCNLYPPTALFSTAITAKSFISFLLFSALSIGWYALFIIVLSHFYKSIHSGILGHSAKHNYKMTSQNQSSPLFALYKKEWKRFVGTPIYITNIGMEIFMSIALCITYAFLGPDKLEEMMQIPDFGSLFSKIAPFVVSILLGMSCSTCSALSLEGKNLWIIKSSPVSAKLVYDSKILVNLTLLLPASLFNSILLCRKMSLFSGFLLFIIPIVFCFFTSVFGMFLNCKMPNYDWESEMTVVKQSIPSMLGILGTPLIIIACAALPFIFGMVNYQIISLVIALLIVILTKILYQKIQTISL